MNPSNVPQLAGLDELARRDGIDTRPTLVRVLTDLYVQKSAHSAEEERHYTELVLRLIDAVDVKTRGTVAAKLADYPGAPPAVVERLARDVIEVAEPILRNTTVLTGQELVAIVDECGLQHAAAIAGRNELAPPLAPQLAPEFVPEPPAPVPTPIPPIPSARSVDRTDTLLRLHLDRLASGMSLGELFLAADSAKRRVLLADIPETDRDGEASVLPEADTIGKLEAAALGRNPALFSHELARALEVSEQLARRIVADEAGEPILVAAKALAVPPDVLLRFLLFLNPAIGESVQRVFDLARLYDGIAAPAARALIASLRQRQPATRAALHRPVAFDDEAGRGRRGAANLRRMPTAPARLEEPSRRPEPARLESGGVL